MLNLVSSYWSRLAVSSLCELVELFVDKVPLPDIDLSCKDRVFNPWRTFWLFLGQILTVTQTCREALRKAQVWLSLSLTSGTGNGNSNSNTGTRETKTKTKTNKKIISSNTSGYCQARSRLDQGYLDKVNREVVEQIENQPQSNPNFLWCGRHVKVVDGSSVSMPDTEENQELYPQPKGQKQGCGFPVMRIVATFSLATGILIASRRGSLNVHERTLWHQMWDCYEENDVVVADRGFCSFADFWMLSKKKVDSVMRLHQQRGKKKGKGAEEAGEGKGVKIIKKFNKNDYLVQWKKTGKHPRWLTPKEWQEVPETITVRHVKINIDIPGFRTRKIIVATTLLDNIRYPMEALAELYRRRWLAELFLRDMKTTMRMDVLRCKTPELVHKEFTIFIIAYNLIRSLILQAALEKGIDPYRISVAGAIATIRQWAPILATRQSLEEKEACFNLFLKLLASDTLPERTEPQIHPRAIKRRPKNYQLLTKPRHEFQEIPHRHKYRKNLALS